MRWENIYVAGLGAYLPEQVQTADEAVALGLYDADERVGNGIHAVRVANDEEAAPVMAAAAARTAVARSGHDAQDFGLVVHACIGHQGQEFWTPAHYVQQETVGGRGSAVEIHPGSNGGLAGVELAASYLTARPAETAALITVADAFKTPYFDRWASDNQQVYGDGAGALVLSKRGGFLRLVSTASLTDATLEPIYRGVTGWTEAPFADGKPVDLRSRKRDYLLLHEDAYEATINQMTVNAGQVLQEALDEADMKLADAQHFVHANIAESIATYSFYMTLGVDRATTTYDWGQNIGHCGGADQLLGLNHLAEAGRLKAGDKIVTMGVGVGFTWTVAVLEVESAPSW
ncbi:ketoacyl-ACP synthase III family protein [Streptacidiphilus jiangxiensis]|uniref:3-oxoacyl-[acyl-carrier-protein] synthase-3 n=1 Tax=Streptacidiphilus jiangxiensis TaxID=235985 RepID=A0A1H7I9W2_STRJI|nr:ketoacyl-ACP synthase III family protein [Streptacidiphilus jiangxiensis]SEK59134.1 3-oxoacyl-[acyl-carrier-protein] synthase-3 [Streptacidiphilus jiangxiensis]